MSEFQCPNCGGNMEGDGYSIVFHCENIDCPMDVEPDADPCVCDFDEHPNRYYSDPPGEHECHDDFDYSDPSAIDYSDRGDIFPDPDDDEIFF